MPSAPIDVDPDTYLSAGDVFLTANDVIGDAVAAAATSAGGGGGMAGSDSSGVDWSSGYDDAAAAALTTGASLVDALGHVGTLLAASADNHASADASSVPGGPPVYPGDGWVPGAVAVDPATPPSADGTSADPPHGWFLVAHLLAYTWPNGHQDQLRAVAAGWTAAAEQMTAAAVRLTPAVTDVSALQSPEVADAVTTCCSMQQSCRDLSAVYSTLGQACSDYAAELDEAHSGVVRELIELAAESAFLQVVSALAAVPTAGASEVAGQGAEEARLALAASRIARILDKLIELVGAVTRTLRTLVTRIASVLTRVRTVLAKGGANAIERIAGRLPRPTASCDIRKFSEYVLSAGRDHGKLAIYQRFGYGPGDAEELVDLYVRQAAARYGSGDYALGTLDTYGQRVTINIVLPGKGAASGTEAIIKSGWIIESGGTLRMTTPFAGWG